MENAFWSVWFHCPTNLRAMPSDILFTPGMQFPSTEPCTSNLGSQQQGGKFACMKWNLKVMVNPQASMIFQKCQPKMSKQIHLFDLFRMSQQFDLLCIPTVFRIPALFTAICNSPLSPTQKVKKTDRVATPRACQFNKCKPHRYPFLSAQEDVMFIQFCCFTTLSAVNFVHAKRERNSRLSMSWSKHILTFSKAPLSYLEHICVK